MSAGSRHKVIAIIEPMSCGREYILQSRRMGYQVIVFTANKGERKLLLKYASEVNHLIEIDTNNDVLVLERCIELSLEMNIIAVLPGFEYYVPLAARVSHALQLPGLLPEHADALRLKHLMRYTMKAHQLRAPAFSCVNNEADFFREINAYSFPVVIKPVDCSGSMHVKRADTLTDAIDIFRKIIANEKIDMDRVSMRQVLIEEYITGKELSVDGYVDGGEIHILSVTQKLLGEEPWFVEVGHIVECDITDAEREEILDYAKKIIGAFHITLGPFHCELRQSAKGPVLMEIASRLPGDQISELICIAKNINIYELSLNCYIGKSNGKIKIQQDKYAGVRFLVRPGLHSFQHMTGLEHFENKSWVKEVTMYYGPGDFIPDATDWRGRIGYGIFEADSHHELCIRMDHFNEMVQFS